MSEHDPLAGDELLARARAAYEPSDEAQARMKRSIDAAIAAAVVTTAVSAGVATSKSGAAVGAATSAASTASAASVGISIGAKLAIALVLTSVTVAGLTWGPTLLGPSTDEPRAERSAEARSTEPTGPRAGVSAGETETDRVEAPVAMPDRDDEASLAARPDEASTGTAEVTSHPAPRARAVAPLEPEEPEVDTLALELELVDEAEDALARRDASSALGALDRHRREHPHGRLATEREVLRVLALCALERDDEARRAYDALRDTALTATTRARLAASCAAP